MYTFWRLIILFASISAIVLVGTLVLCILCFWIRTKKSSGEGKFPMEPDNPGGPVDWDNMSALLIIEHDQLSLERELGAGAFGRVFAGYWKPTEDEDKKGKHTNNTS